MKNKKVLIGVLSLIFAFTIIGWSKILSIQMQRNCTGYLKRAADANTVETAKDQLHKAIAYLEENNLTKGYTSAIYNTPDEDIAFWFNNLKSSEQELDKVINSKTSSSTETSNVLMKLRETLIDNGEKGDHLTVPDGLSRFPNNLVWGIFRILAYGVVIICGLYIYIKLEE